MKIEIRLISGSSFKDLVKPALDKCGFSSYSEFAKLVAEKTCASEHAELNSLSNILNGKTTRVSAERAKVYAEILNIPKKDLVGLCGAGNFYQNQKPVVIEDDSVITVAVKNLAARSRVTMEDLIKEILYRQHQ